MSHRRYCLIASLILAAAIAQGNAEDSSKAPHFEEGLLKGGVYSNACLGFSFRLPEGWDLADKIVGADRKAMHTGKGLTLLMLHEPTAKPPGNTITLSARDSSLIAGTLQYIVSYAVHQEQQNAPHEELLRDAFPVEFGERTFYRADSRRFINNDLSLYQAMVTTRFRGYLIGAEVVTRSAEELDKSVNTLRGTSFLEDRVDPRCRLGPQENVTPKVGIITGIISSRPAVSPSGIVVPIHVSGQLAEGLLLKRVEPLYPEDARKAGVQGQVILEAEIDSKGDVKGLTLISGPSSLVTSALEAVRQWKYKPYRLNGEPVAIQTQIVVNFTLSQF
ncbi:MAG: energy transducer TonB [Terriglobales bacterium]